MGIVKSYIYEGKKYTLAQAAREFGISGAILYYRTTKMNMTFEEAIKTPVQERNKIYNYEGKEYTIQQAAKEFGVGIETLRQRLVRGMTFKEAVKAPIQYHNKTYSYNGKEYTLTQAAEEFGVCKETLCDRMKRMNMTFEDAINFVKPKFVDWEKQK